jgi:PPP family 3-phenylpropionic acid transporter
VIDVEIPLGKEMSWTWPFAFYFLLYAASASVTPFIVLYYQGLGFTGAQIGLLTGITPLITLFCAPLWTGLADATYRHRLILSLAILVGALALFAYPLLQAFAAVLLIAILLNVALAPIMPFADSATLFMLADKRELYGRIRLGGTLGYGLAAPIAGVLVQKYGLRFAFWGCAALFLLGFIVSQKLVYGQLKAEQSAGGRVRTLLTSPRWLLFLIAAFSSGVSLAGLTNYFFPYMKELGANESTMGLALTVGTLSEVPVLFFGNQLLKRLGSYRLLMLTLTVTGIRLVLFAASTTPALVLFIQLLNGLTFPAIWVAGVAYAAENAPAGMSTTAQGLFSAMVLGFGTAVGGFVGGPLLESVGGRGLYLVFGLVVLVTVAIVTLIQRSLPAEQASPRVMGH